jgi:GAF domain-containing protein
MSLLADLDRLAHSLQTDGSNASGLSFPSIAMRIAKELDVKSEEVAILTLSERWRNLRFIVPEQLKNVGYIPLTSKSALAARTARERQAEIINDFSYVKHASVFEGVKLASDAEAIQKIISAPILKGEKVIGVIQISRKGPNRHGAGPDFTAADLGKVQAFCKPLAEFLKHLGID